MPTYFIKDASEVLSATGIRHFSLEKQALTTTEGWLPDKRPLDVVLTCGASCPDAVLEEVLLRVLSFFDDTRATEDALAAYPAAE